MECKTKKCVPLSDLELSLRFNLEIYGRCGRFQIHLVDSSTGEEVDHEPQVQYAVKVLTCSQVAGIAFKLLENKEILKLAENQAKIKTLTTKLKRRKTFSHWDYGEMRPVGSHQPSGGQPRDGYSPYPATTIVTLEDVHTLFSYASVSLSCS
ncbi:hypothetical protein JVT61DRAFT_9543 [Boletus reticuloceps]|uniref:Uncharacterized protein n=1 Tax=Boletus reticuloceps TaxID=495285 RepID=A0A8I3A5M1_9AGAM|nr:hypothetical protein JVT61DRAFT_9543 [Boletus reticuloceps]